MKEQHKGDKNIKHLTQKTAANYFIDVLQILLFLIVFITGLTVFSGFLDFFGINRTHLPLYEFTVYHIWLGLFIGVVVFGHVILHWRWIKTMTKVMIKKIRKRQFRQFTRNLRNYFLDWVVFISSISVFITGILKFPGVLQRLGTNPAGVPMYEISLVHHWSGVLAGSFIIIHVLFHWKWLVITTQKVFLSIKTTKFRLKTAFSLIIGLVIILGVLTFPLSQIIEANAGNGRGKIIIKDIGKFRFRPKEVNTTRGDIFRPGHFSIFDILVHLDKNGAIDMNYHFDITMNTHVIDSINGKEGWWYTAYYHGGWKEDNVFRMDHYPYKARMFIKLYQLSDLGLLNRIYSVHKEEVERLEQNGGNVIIPTVTIRGGVNAARDEINYRNVVITAHNLRNDTFQDGVITALDVLLTLGDQGRLSYKLEWFDYIGTSKVGNYFVVELLDDTMLFGRCGYVYEEGSHKFEGRYGGNHIHIPSDIRVLNSPEYELWYWRCA